MDERSFKYGNLVFQQPKDNLFVTKILDFHIEIKKAENGFSVLYADLDRVDFENIPDEFKPPNEFQDFGQAVFSAVNHVLQHLDKDLYYCDDMIKQWKSKKKQRKQKRRKLVEILNAYNNFTANDDFLAEGNGFKLCNANHYDESGKAIPFCWYEKDVPACHYEDGYDFFTVQISRVDKRYKLLVSKPYASDKIYWHDDIESAIEQANL